MFGIVTDCGLGAGTRIGTGCGTGKKDTGGANGIPHPGPPWIGGKPPNAGKPNPSLHPHSNGLADT